MYTNEELWEMVRKGVTEVDSVTLYGNVEYLKQYSTKDFSVIVGLQYGQYCTEVARLKGRNKAAKKAIYAAKLNELRSIYDSVYIAEKAMHTKYAFEYRVADTVNKIMSGNLDFRPYQSQNGWHSTSNRNYELWFQYVTGEEAPELTGPRWNAVYTLVKDELGFTIVNPKTF